MVVSFNLLGKDIDIKERGRGDPSFQFSFWDFAIVVPGTKRAVTYIAQMYMKLLRYECHNKKVKYPH